MANTKSVRSCDEGWCQSRDKYGYSDKYRILGVKWYRVVGVARPATVRLSVGTEWHDRVSLGRPSCKGLSCGQGSVARTNILEPDGDLLEVPKGDVVRGSTAQRRCWWVKMVT